MFFRAGDYVGLVVGLYVGGDRDRQANSINLESKNSKIGPSNSYIFHCKLSFMQNGIYNSI